MISSGVGWSIVGNRRLEGPSGRASLSDCSGYVASDVYRPCFVGGLGTYRSPVGGIEGAAAGPVDPCMPLVPDLEETAQASGRRSMAGMSVEACFAGFGSCSDLDVLPEGAWAGEEWDSGCWDRTRGLAGTDLRNRPGFHHQELAQYK